MFSAGSILNFSIIGHSQPFISWTSSHKSRYFLSSLNAVFVQAILNQPVKGLLGERPSDFLLTSEVEGSGNSYSDRVIQYGETALKFCIISPADGVSFHIIRPIIYPESDFLSFFSP